MITNETHNDGSAVLEASASDQFRRLLDRPARGKPIAFGGVVVGELLALKDEGRTPLVSYPKQSNPEAIVARSVVDLYASHVGRQVVLVFENADPAKPIVIGTLCSEARSPFETRPGTFEVDSDGERLIVSAKEQLVLRCGQASITLTKEGEVLLRGTYLSTHASGVNRIQGGSVQIN
jgi:Domain of unknown function (DUF6484)